MKQWTQDDYRRWLQERGPVGSWKPEDCRAADELVKRETLKNFRMWCESHISPPVSNFLQNVVRAHFGSVEVDELLCRIGGMYPEWMEQVVICKTAT